MQNFLWNSKSGMISHVLSFDLKGVSVTLPSYTFQEGFNEKVGKFYHLWKNNCLIFYGLSAMVPVEVVILPIDG